MQLTVYTPVAEAASLVEPPETGRQELVSTQSAAVQ